MKRNNIVNSSLKSKVSLHITVVFFAILTIYTQSDCSGWHFIVFIEYPTNVINIIFTDQHYVMSVIIKEIISSWKLIAFAQFDNWNKQQIPLKLKVT